MAGENDIGPAADPELLLPGASLAWFARIALSGICSIRPAPNTGVGMRKITLRRASSFSKSGLCGERASGRVRPAGDREQIVDAAVRRSVGFLHEPRLAHRPFRRE